MSSRRHTCSQCHVNVSDLGLVLLLTRHDLVHPGHQPYNLRASQHPNTTLAAHTVLTACIHPSEQDTQIQTRSTPETCSSGTFRSHNQLFSVRVHRNSTRVLSSRHRCQLESDPETVFSDFGTLLIVTAVSQLV